MATITFHIATCAAVRFFTFTVQKHCPLITQLVRLFITTVRRELNYFDLLWICGAICCTYANSLTGPLDRRRVVAPSRHPITGQWPCVSQAASEVSPTSTSSWRIIPHAVGFHNRRFGDESWAMTCAWWWQAASKHVRILRVHLLVSSNKTTSSAQTWSVNVVLLTVIPMVPAHLDIIQLKKRAGASTPPWRTPEVERDVCWWVLGIWIWNQMQFLREVDEKRWSTCWTRCLP